MRQAGTATITTQASDKTAICVITVKTIVNPVENVSLNETTLTLMRGETGKLTATVTPENADDKTVTWSSSHADVATVDADGTVTTHKAGETIITATTQEGGKTAICTVIVNPILVETVTLNMTELTLTRGETGKLTATVMPENADDKTVTWSSSHTDVATVDADGTVTAVKAGTATITARAGDKRATCMVTIHVHSYSGGKCTVCGKRPYMTNGTIDDTGVLTKYSGTEAMVVIPDGVTGIGSSAFSGCTKLTGVLLSDGITPIVTIPDNVTSIGKYAFYECKNLSRVAIPDSVTSIGDSAFYGCTSLTSVTIPDSVTEIGDSAFRGCRNLRSVTIPSSVTSIGNRAFSSCESLASVKIPDGVTSIGEEAFSWCRNLTSVTILVSVMSIGDHAFDGSTGLTTINYTGTKEQWNAITKDIYWDYNTGDYTITYNYKK